MKKTKTMLLFILPLAFATPALAQLLPEDLVKIEHFLNNGTHLESLIADITKNLVNDEDALLRQWIKEQKQKKIIRNNAQIHTLIAALKEIYNVLQERKKENAEVDVESSISDSKNNCSKDKTQAEYFFNDTSEMEESEEPSAELNPCVNTSPEEYVLSDALATQQNEEERSDLSPFVSIQRKDSQNEENPVILALKDDANEECESNRMQPELQSASALSSDASGDSLENNLASNPISLSDAPRHDALYNLVMNSPSFSYDSDNVNPNSIDQSSISQDLEPQSEKSRIFLSDMSENSYDPSMDSAFNIAEEAEANTEPSAPEAFCISKFGEDFDQAYNLMQPLALKKANEHEKIIEMLQMFVDAFSKGELDFEELKNLYKRSGFIAKSKRNKMVIDAFQKIADLLRKKSQ